MLIKLGTNRCSGDWGGGLLMVFRIKDNMYCTVVEDHKATLYNQDSRKVYETIDISPTYLLRR